MVLAGTEVLSANLRKKWLAQTFVQIIILVFSGICPKVKVLPEIFYTTEVEVDIARLFEEASSMSKFQ